MEFEELKLVDYQQIISDNINNKNEAAMYAIVPKTIVYKGKGNLDLQYCSDNDIEVYNSIDFGGGIVASSGDIIIIIIKQDGWDVGNIMLNYLKDMLTTKNIDASIDGNDIITDGQYKSASYSSTNIGNNVIYTGIQISFDTDNEKIGRICLKNSTKIPRGLGYYKLNNTDVLKDILKFIRNNF